MVPEGIINKERRIRTWKRVYFMSKFVITKAAIKRVYCVLVSVCFRKKLYVSTECCRLCHNGPKFILKPVSQFLFFRLIFFVVLAYMIAFNVYSLLCYMPWHYMFSIIIAIGYLQTWRPVVIGGQYGQQDSNPCNQWAVQSHQGQGYPGGTW